MLPNKLYSLLSVLTLAVSGSLCAGTPYSKQVAPQIQPAEPLFGPGFHLGGHALFLTPDADRADDTWGGGANLDYFFTSYVGVQVSGSWADPGTSETWHNYAADLVFRAPFERAHFAPYIFAGGGAIVEDDAEMLGRAGAGLEFRPTANFGVFADWIYNFPGGDGGEDDVEDYQMVRMGVKFKF